MDPATSVLNFKTKLNLLFLNLKALKPIPLRYIIRSLEMSIR